MKNINGLTLSENCPKCEGKGRLYLSEGVSGPVTRRCDCVLLRGIASNVERGWSGLVRSGKTLPEKSLLSDHVSKSVFIRSDTQNFKDHMRHVAFRQGPDWSFKVASDAELMVAWLANITLSGAEIYDPDIHRPSLEALTLVDLVLPPQLLVIRLGVKAARNVATPEVLLEALNLREHQGLPTWVTDQPDKPLQEDHLCWSPEVKEYFSTWKKIKIGVDVKRNVRVEPKSLSQKSSFNMKQMGSTKTVVFQDNRSKKK